MHTLQPRGVDEDLELRPRGRQFGDLAGQQLEGDGLPPGGVEVRPHHRLDDRQEPADDPVVVQAGHVIEAGLDLLHQLRGPRPPGAGVQGLRGVELGLEQGDQQPGQIDVRDQRLGDVGLAERDPHLAEVAADRAQQADVAPTQIGTHHQGVEAVDLAQAGVRGGEGVHQLLPRLRRPAGRDGGRPAGDGQPQVVDERALVVAHRQLVRPLVDHVDAENRQVRQDLGQRHRGVASEDLQPQVGLIDAPVRIEHGHRHVMVTLQGEQGGQILGGLLGGVVLLVALREGPDQRGQLVLIVGPGDGVGELVVPRPGGQGQLAFQRAYVDLAHRLADRHPHHEMQSSQHRLGDPGRVVDRRTAQPAHQDVLHPLADGGGVAVPRQIDQAGQVATVRVAANEQPDLAAFLQVGDLLHHRSQLGGRGLEQFVPRIALQHVHDRLAAMAVLAVSRPLQDRDRLLPQHRHSGDALGVGRGREQAQEAALADDLALGIEGPQADVVQVGRPVHPGLVVVLGDHHQVAVGAAGGQRPEGPGHILIGPQDAEPGGRNRLELRPRRSLDQGVLAVAQVGEVVGVQPAEQFAGQGRLFRATRDLDRIGQTDHGLLGSGDHPLPVFDGLFDQSEHLQQAPLEVGDQGVGVVGPSGRQDLQVHPRLRQHRRVMPGVAGGDDAVQVAGEVPVNQELGVEHLANAPAVPEHLHGHRVDEERPVVGDDLHHGGPAGRPAVVALAGGANDDGGPGRRPVQRRSVVAEHQSQQVLDGALVDVDGVHMTEVVPKEDLRGLRLLSQLLGEPGAAFRDQGDLLGLLLLQLELERRHSTSPPIMARLRCQAQSDLSPRGPT